MENGKLRSLHLGKSVNQRISLCVQVGILKGSLKSMGEVGRRIKSTALIPLSLRSIGNEWWNIPDPTVQMQSTSTKRKQSSQLSIRISCPLLSLHTGLIRTPWLQATSINDTMLCCLGRLQYGLKCIMFATFTSDLQVNTCRFHL